MKDKAPLVSVGLPVYNGENFLEEALDSILAQTFRDFELIISDNASKDRTQEICKAYASEDHRIRYYRAEKNHGAAWNYNRVFELSTGQYFKWAAHDDKCAPSFLQRCLELLAISPDAVICYPRTTLIDENGNTVAMDENTLNLSSQDILTRFRDTLNPMRLCHNVMFGLMRSQILGNTRLLGNYLAADRCLLAELSLYGPFLEIPEYLFYRRKRPGNIGTSIEHMEFYDPSRKVKFVLPEWRVFFEHIISVKRSPLTCRVKIPLIFMILTWAYSKRLSLMRQLKWAGELIMNNHKDLCENS